MGSTKRHTTPEAIEATKKATSNKYHDERRRQIIERDEIPIKNPAKNINKNPEKVPAKLAYPKIQG